MTAKEYLLQLKVLNAKLDHECMEWEEIRSRAMANASPRIKERVQTSSLAEPMDDAIRAVDLERKIKRHQDEYAKLRRTIIDQIHGLPNPQHINILYKRYVMEKTFEQISTEMGYSYQYTINMHGAALRAFGNKWLERCDKM